MNPITLFLAAAAGLAGITLFLLVSPWAGAPLVLMAVLITLSLKVANAWQKFVILRAGNLHSVKGPGLFLIVPVIDQVAAVIDERIQTTAFNAEQALTRDTVPVNVDAIIFWHVHDAERAALDITDYRQAIDRVAQTSLREMIGASMLSALLSDRKTADEHLREVNAFGAPAGFADGQALSGADRESAHSPIDACLDNKALGAVRRHPQAKA